MKPLMLESIYALGFFREYLTPACAAKLQTKSNFRIEIKMILIQNLQVQLLQSIIFL